MEKIVSSINTSQYMDKQIMDLSNSHSCNNNNNNNKDFINLINPQEHSKKEETMPSYDFQSIRLRPTPSPPSSIDSGNGGARDSKVNSISRMKEEQSVHGSDEEIDDPPEVDNDEDLSDDGHEQNQEENYGSLESTEPAKVIFEKDRNIYDAALLSEIDQAMKKHVDNLLHALVGVSARLSQLESRTRHLENSVDDLKESVGNNHGSTDGKMRQLENILREVETGVQVVRDKQETLEAQLQLAKKGEQQSEIQSTMHIDPVQQASSAPLQSHHHFPPIALTQSPPTYPPPNAPLLSHQNLPLSPQLPNQYSQNQIPPAPQPQHESYFPPSGQTPEKPNLQYQLPLQQQLQPQPPSPPQQQFQPSPLPQYSQPPPPTQRHASLSVVNAPQSQPPPLGHHPEETPYIPSQNFPSSMHQPPSHPPSGAGPSYQFYGTPSHMYESSSSRPGPGFSPAYGPSSVPSEPYPYGRSASQYGHGSPMKSQQLSSLSIGQSGGSAYPQLPTAQILPHGLRTASGVDGGSSSAGTGNKVPIDDVVEKMTNMGFPRDHVRATVRRLTDNGQSVDLNVVLDKLMNDGEVQPPRGWPNR